MTAFADPINTSAEESAPTTRCRIIATAERFFREIGYQKTTVADIAKTLKMSPANIYRFFDSKKAINEAVFSRVMREIEAMIAAIADAPRLSAADRLARTIHALHDDCVARCEDNPRLHEMIEAAMIESWGVCRPHVAMLVAVFERLIADGVARGEFSVGDTELAAACVQAALMRYCHPVLVSAYVGRGEMPSPPLEAMIAFVLAGLRGS